MNIYEVKEKSPLLLQTLLHIWEDSVRATHLFLSDQEIMKIKEYIPEVLDNVPHLVVAERTPGCPIAFLGTKGERLEMLFLSPEVRGTGLGRLLLEYGVSHYGIREVTVNEQNPGAIGFYRHMGFEVCRRTDSDEEGNPYPLLYMRLI